ncbi:Hpt domain-containing protein [Pseudidiomarina salilacus]|uniref:Hpt domain-containing protein n=1 Tax=Pseudidiomarina salilacus TaxID=3384452 RepID=UPI003984F8B3
MMIDKHLLEQYAELMGTDGVREMYDTFADNIGGYLNHLQWLVKERKEDEFRQQSHKVKGACRSIGLKGLAEQMERFEKADWQWSQVDEEFAQWQNELPLHQKEVERWLQSQ